MCLLFETIKVKGNTLINIEYHNARVHQSRKDIFGATDLWDLCSLIEQPSLNPEQVYRCKFIYGLQFQSVEFIPYSIKPVNSLKLINVANIDYNYKYLDRSILDNLKLSCPETDDVIFVFDSNISDCTYANLVFFDGENWITPSTPLLKGTKRQFYIDEQIITERVVKVKDLNLFIKMKIINAMIDFDESPEIQIENIFR